MEANEIKAPTGKITDELETPRWLFDKFNNQFRFNWDACASDANHLCDNYWTYEQNALLQDWGGGKSIWNNYPYSDPMPFLEKSVEGVRQGSFVAALGKFDPTTEWFNKWVLPYASIRILNKRVRFYLGGVPSEHTATFTSALFIYTPFGSVDSPRQISFWDYHSEGDPKLLAGFDQSY